ncbi:MAG: hypothetical protein COA81_02190 [Alphaproteobacteria bacterium]|nr:MAG: hypothetical protein COA81_02190 [Alphaproteobacteria bacterium]
MKNDHGSNAGNSRGHRYCRGLFRPCHDRNLWRKASDGGGQPGYGIGTGDHWPRGMNDAPKLGGLMAGLRVTRMLAEKVTVMNHHEGFTANIVTSMLVSSGAIFGLPMSTTHVSASALIGVGVSGKKGNLHMGAVKVMLAAWVITLPGAAAFGIILFWLGRFMQA